MGIGKRLTSPPELRVAIIGTDSSRPGRLLEFLTGQAMSGQCRVTHLVAPDGGDPAGLAGRYGIGSAGEQVTDVLGAADVALVCTRDGRDHAAQVLPLLEAGISVWVDKPLATREEDARAMVRTATAAGLVLACRSGFRDARAVRQAARWLRHAEDAPVVGIEGPAAPESPYGGLAHYGIHHAEIACELAERAGWVLSGPVTGLVADGDGLRATVGGDGLTMELGFRSPVRGTGFLIKAGDRLWPVEAPARYLEDQVGAFLTGVREGRGTPDPGALVAPVRLLDRILAPR